jgi:hypothetical protein
MHLIKDAEERIEENEEKEPHDNAPVIIASIYVDFFGHFASNFAVGKA